ncbi:sulfatase-like hydrolase/transferase [Saccharophagus degradans]|uniref:sulfatase-like hydrolase/transferase n=1 Tax=Saccharophagus degradans TaxID=86304 RepID=UPI001C09662F|nr:sulfatase-like hydrolase/transferase [Saccharophagus degradans]MBU2986629.1 sulfatase-like hydrolase/transferase [Saccharophagus degradans]
MKIKSKLAAAALALGAFGSSLANAQDERPNILVFLLDDLGYADVGFMPDAEEDIYTPNIDDLANNGTVFTAAYASHPYCGPSRAGIMTGRYQHEHGSQFNLAGYSPEGIDLSETFFSTLIQDAGYNTGLIGKWHLGEEHEFQPNQRGFDYFYGMLGGGHVYNTNDFIRVANYDASNTGIWDYRIPLRENNGYAPETNYDQNLYVTDMFTDAGVTFIENSERNDNQPFFLMMNYTAPHTPEEAKPQDEIDLRAILGSSASNNAARHTYSAMVYGVDRGIQKIVDTLRQTGEFDNTMIIFTSDNGGRLNDANARNTPLQNGKTSVREGGIRVPMFIHWPQGNLPRGNYDHVVSLLDLYPTLVDVAQATVPASKEIDGKNILPDVRTGANVRENEPLFFMMHEPRVSGGRNQSAVILNNHKWYSQGTGNWVYFNLETDIGERRGLQNGPHRELMVGALYDWTCEHVAPYIFDNPAYGWEQAWQDNGMPNFGKTFPDMYNPNDCFDPNQPINRIELSPNPVNVIVGSTQQITADITPANAANKSLNWRSSNNNIAVVNGQGVVTGVAEGTVTITATATDGSLKTASTEVNIVGEFDNLLVNAGFESGGLNWVLEGVTAVVGNNSHSGNNAAFINGNGAVAQYINLEPDTQYMLRGWAKVGAAGQSVYMGATNSTSSTFIDNTVFSNTQYVQQGFTFTSSSDAEDSYRIWVWNNGGGEYYADDIELVKVDGDSNPQEPIRVDSVSVTPLSVTLNEGETQQVSVTVLPANADNTNVSWSSANTGIATVNSAGVITAVSAGNTTITVTSQDSNRTDTVAVTVNAVVASNLVENAGFETGGLNNWPTSYGASSVVNNNAHTGSHAAYVNGNGAIEQDFSVLPNTTYTLSAWVKVGAAGQTAYLGVKNFGGNEIGRLMTSTAYTQESITFTTVANANSARIYVWNGDANHRVYADDFIVVAHGADNPTEPEPEPEPEPDTGTDPEDCSANWIRVTGVEMSASNINMSVGEQVVLDYSIFPSCASQPNVTFLSSNWQVVSPNNNGTMTARRAGTVTITVRTKDGQFEDSTTIVVR